jgi:hypothetical protein
MLDGYFIAREGRCSGPRKKQKGVKDKDMGKRQKKRQQHTGEL